MRPQLTRWYIKITESTVNTVINPQEPQIRQGLFCQMYFIQQFAKVFYRQHFPLYGILAQYYATLKCMYGLISIFFIKPCQCQMYCNIYRLT